MYDKIIAARPEFVIFMFDYEGCDAFADCLENILLQEVNFTYKAIIETKDFSPERLEIAEEFSNEYPDVFELRNEIDFSEGDGKVVYTLYNQYITPMVHFFQECYNFKTEPNDIMVSISMSAYNQQGYIAKSIESILFQETNFKYELIVGEDCSTDGTRRIVERYRRRFPDIIRPIYYMKNVGLKTNDDIMRRRMRGKYRAILEGDDCWLIRDKLQRQVDFLEKNPNFVAETGEYITVNSSYQEIERGNPQIYSHTEIYDINELQKWLMPSNTLCVMHRNIYLDWSERKMHDYITESIIGDRKMYLMLIMYGDIYHSTDMYCMRVFRPVTKTSWSYAQKHTHMCPITHTWLTNAENFAREQYGKEIDLTEVKINNYVVCAKCFAKNPSKRNYDALKKVRKAIPKAQRKRYNAQLVKETFSFLSKYYKGRNIFTGTFVIIGKGFKFVKKAVKGLKTKYDNPDQHIKKFL